MIIKNLIKTAAVKRIMYPQIIKVYVNVHSLVMSYYITAVLVYKSHLRVRSLRGFPEKLSSFSIDSSNILMYRKNLVCSNICSERLQTQFVFNYCCILAWVSCRGVRCKILHNKLNEHRINVLGHYRNCPYIVR